MFTVGVYFDGDDSLWTIRSDRNSFDTGLTITKSWSQSLGNHLTVSLSLYDMSSGNYTLHEKTVRVKDLKENFICVSLDAFKGSGYFYFNNDIVSSFSLPLGQFYKKMILYGDFFLLHGNSKSNILNHGNPAINNVFLVDIYIDPSMVFILPIIDGRMRVDDIYISLPCGMKNSVDEVDFLQTICGSATFKSNDFNIKIKNLSITNPDVIKGIKDSITTSLKSVIPITSQINSIDIENYK